MDTKEYVFLGALTGCTFATWLTLSYLVHHHYNQRELEFIAEINGKTLGGLIPMINQPNGADWLQRMYEEQMEWQEKPWYTKIFVAPPKVQTDRMRREN